MALEIRSVAYRLRFNEAREASGMNKALFWSSDPEDGVCVAFISQGDPTDERRRGESPACHPVGQ